MLEGAIRYQQLIETIDAQQERVSEDTGKNTPGHPDIPELELQSRWFSGDFGRRFTSTCGQQVEIIQYGHWNHSFGPDFSDTAVRIGNQQCRGAIELDVNVRDWDHHGHANNPAYENVVLHLFFEQPAQRYFTKTLNHRNVVQVKLTLDALPESLNPLPYQPEAKPGRCAPPFAQMSLEAIDHVLIGAAQYRLERKAQRLNRQAEIHGFKEMLYQALAETLGYRHNQLPMRILAQRLPVTQMHFKKQRAEVEALLFGSAGFINGPPRFEEADEETKTYLRALWDTWWKRQSECEIKEATALCWKLAGARPANHPQRRLGALVSVLHDWKTFESLFQQDAFDLRKLKSYFAQLEHPYWSRHYTLAAKRLPKPMALIGETRVQEFLANQIFPYLLQHDRTLWNQYASLRATLQNEKVRKASMRLFGNHPQKKELVKYVYQHQALLQIFDDFCLTDASECKNCPFPEQSQHWDKVVAKLR